ncbi:ImmA/IrrE family metallo-endopeptidase [Streptococcus equinus]|nr:ImmA/IrrE family metallo-endopeptidase [Streptococcus equinus]
MCHELGHFVLGHSGKCFTELRGKSDSVKEREANIFSATVLMPDIVLLAKIFYRKDSFQK